MNSAPIRAGNPQSWDVCTHSLCDRRLYHSRRRAESDGYKSLRHVRCWIGPAGSIMPPPVYGISREDGRKKGEGGKKQLVIGGGRDVDEVVDEVVL